MIAVYVRTSTKGQKLDSQKSEISKWLKANGVATESVEWYADQETGTTLDRPQFNRLQQDIFAGKVKTVILWKLDRLSRRLHEGIQVLADWCERGVRVTVVTQQIELSGAVGRMIAALLLGLAEIENEFRRERQVAGIEVAKKRGIYKGRKPGTFKGKPTRARELHVKGLDVSEIAKSMGVSRRRGKWDSSGLTTPLPKNPGVIDGP